MSWQNTLFLLAAAVLAVFWEAAFNGLRNLLGAQIDLLPSLMIYAALFGRMSTIVLLALVGGLSFDSLSANPLGITVIPLFVIGFVIYISRDLILRDQFFAQVTLGLAASAIAPLLTLLLLLSAGSQPLLGWGTLWQWIVMSIGGAVATPIWFEIFGWLNRTFVYARVTQTSFRSDREIRRGR